MEKIISGIDSCIQHLPVAYACQQVITDEKDHPVDYRVVDANPAFGDATGLSAEAMAGQRISDVFADMSATPLHWSHYYEQASSGNGSQRFKLGNKTGERWYEVVVYCERPGYLTAVLWDVSHFVKIQGKMDRENDPQEEVACITEQLRDVTEEKQILEKLKNSQQVLKEIQRIALIGRWELNHITSELSWSDTIFQICEVNQDSFETSYEGFLQVVHPEDRDKVHQAFQKSLVDQCAYEITHRLLLKDGRVKWVYEKYESWFDDKGKPLLTVGIVQDISTLKKAEEALHEQQRHLRTILETTKDGFWVVNREGRIIDVNQAYSSMSGYTAKELLTMSIEDIDILETPEMTRNRIRQIYEKGSEIFETRHRKKDGSSMDVEVSVSCSDPKIGELVSFFRDISGRNQQEKTLRNAIQLAETANAAKTRYLAHMNHEIRTPLNGLMGFLQMMEETQMDEEQQEMVKHMKLSSSHMLSIVNNVLDYAKIEAGEMELNRQPFHLENEIKAAMSPLRSLVKQKKIDFQLTMDENLPCKVTGDPQRLRQIILNVGGNAIKFTNQGKVHITISCQETTQAHHTLKLVVEDTGSGMTEETLSKIFQPFYQVDDGSVEQTKGTGLGMPITRELVELMQGEIQVNSTPGKGTLIEVQLKLGKVKEGRTNIKV